MPDARTVPLLLRERSYDDKAAFARLVPVVYDEFRRIAEGQTRREYAQAAVSIGSDRNLRTSYVAQSLAGLASVCRILATAQAVSPARSEADWREARASAVRPGRVDRHSRCQPERTLHPFDQRHPRAHRRRRCAPAASPVTAV